MAGAGVIRKVLGGAAKAPGAIAGFAGATTVGIAGGAIKATGQGIASGVKAAGKMKTKILGEAAEAATKSSDDVAKAARKPVNNYRKNTSFTYDNASYRIQDGAYQRKTSGGNWENISSKEYGHQRGGFIGENQALEQAAINAESGAGFWSGLGDMVQDHPYIAAGIAGGVGVAGGALLFDDDDDY